MKGTNNQIIIWGGKGLQCALEVPVILIVIVNLVLSTFVFSALQYTVYGRGFRGVGIIIKVTRNNKATVVTVWMLSVWIAALQTCIHTAVHLRLHAESHI